MTQQNSYIIDHSPRWQIGYCKSSSQPGKYHLMLTDNIRLFDPNCKGDYGASATRTIGFYTFARTKHVVDFLLTQPTEVLRSVWNGGKI